jgi:hypothetical protein
VLVLQLGSGLAIVLLIAALLIGAQFVSLRWSLVLPAVAVDHPTTFAKSWAATVDCGPQMIGITFLIYLPVVAFNFLAWRSGLLEAFPLSVLLLEDAGSYICAAGWLTLLAFVFRSRSDWRSLPAQVGA